MLCSVKCIFQKLFEPELPFEHVRNDLDSVWPRLSLSPWEAPPDIFEIIMGFNESDRDEVRLRDCQVIINLVSITRANWHGTKTVLI